jgi:hypothetical protein
MKPNYKFTELLHAQKFDFVQGDGSSYCHKKGYPLTFTFGHLLPMRARQNTANEKHRYEV